MKKLILVRHSKAQDLARNDKARSLTLEGKERAYRVAHFLKSFLDTPEIFLSSPASRACQTAEIFLEILGNPTSVLKLCKKLYTFDLQSLKEVIYELEDRFESIILFGHNFALLDFINEFGDQATTKFPPSSVAILKAEVSSWEEFTKGKIEKIIDSKELKPSF